MSPSTLGFALLGLLAREEMTGYQLTKAIGDRVNRFWTAGHSQIYPELARLDAAGLVRNEVIAGPGPRDTKRYRITDAGRSALADWVVVPPASEEPARSEILLKIFSSWLAEPDRILGLLHTMRARHLAARDRYAAIAARDGRSLGHRPHDIGSPQFASYATLRAGLSYQAHVLSWYDWMIAELTAAGGREAGPAGSAGPDHERSDSAQSDR